MNLAASRKLALMMCSAAVCVAVAGCGQSHSLSAGVNATAGAKKSTSVSAADKAAVQKFTAEQSTTIQKVNQGFAVESKLIKQVTTKQLSYLAFQRDYKSEQSAVNGSIQKLATAKAPTGAKQYQSDYVALLKQGATVFAHQEQAILPNRTVDSSKAAALKQALNAFVKQSQVLAAKYPVQ